MERKCNILIGVRSVEKQSASILESQVEMDSQEERSILLTRKHKMRTNLSSNFIASIITMVVMM